MEVQGYMICSEFFDVISALIFHLGVNMSPGNQQYIVTSTNSQTEMAFVYPPGSVSHYDSSAGTYPNQADLSQSGGEAQVPSKKCYPSSVVATEASTAGLTQGTSSVTSQARGHHQHIKRRDNLIMHYKIVDIIWQ